jgi:hypothetical protein
MKTVIQAFLKSAVSRNNEISYFYVLVAALRVAIALIIAFSALRTPTQEKLIAFVVLAIIVLVFSAWVVTQAARRRK